MKQGILVIVSGPSGTGKGTVVAELAKDAGYALSISATTRAPRTGEIEGKSYFFHTPESFRALEESGGFLETAVFCGQCYGTPKAYVEQARSEGKNVILEIEVQGALQIQEQYPDCILVFLVPPSLKELRTRLSGRNTESADAIEKRIARALEEMECLPQYDYVVMNDTVQQARDDIDAIVRAEAMRCFRNTELAALFQENL